MDLVQERPYLIASGRLQLSRAALDSLRWGFGFQFAHQINGVNKPTPVSSPHTRTHNSMFVPSRGRSSCEPHGDDRPITRISACLQFRAIARSACFELRMLSEPKPRLQQLWLPLTYGHSGLTMHVMRCRLTTLLRIPPTLVLGMRCYGCTAEQYSCVIEVNRFGSQP
jgi:hypothetical protein